MAAYYNENNPYAAQWLRNLIANGLIAPGSVDERSIVDVAPSDLRGYTQCHFFAGLGGWSYALRQCGWSDDRPVWTGSCPCQPFSVSGDHKGFDDPRHLWPYWRNLIAERRPVPVFGEQVAAASVWLDLVRSDLEAMGYAMAAVPIEAASAGAEHERDRYWFVADIPLANGDIQRPQISVREFCDIGTERAAAARNNLRGVLDSEGIGWGEGWTESEFRSRGYTAAVANIDDRLYIECHDGKWRRLPPSRVRWLGVRVPARIPILHAIGNSIDQRPAQAFIKAYMETNR